MKNLHHLEVKVVEEEVLLQEVEVLEIQVEAEIEEDNFFYFSFFINSLKTSPLCL